MSKPGFVRSLGLTDSAMLVIGCIVGVGIFRTSGSIAAYVDNPSLILILWLFGGLLSLCGALCYAELAAMFPKSGGDYVYISNTYGKFWGFLFGWTKLFVERTGTIAILGFVFAEYLGTVVDLEEHMVRWFASGAVLALTAINVSGIKWGKYTQNLLTFIKISSLVAIVLIGLFALNRSHTDWSFPLPALSKVDTWQSLGVALVFVLWTYGGWTEAAYVSEEVKDPQRNVPRAILGGILATTVIYILVNFVYLAHIETEEITKTPLVASSMMQKILGPKGSLIIGCMVACSAFGALNGYILTGARILYALGQDHALFNSLGKLNQRFRTPAVALWLNAALAILLIFTKTFDQIMTYSTVVISVFFIMAVIAIFFLRKKRPDLPRPYRAWGYPITPLIYVIVMTGFILDVCIKQPAESAFGFIFLIIGLPLYWLSQKIQTRQTAGKT